MTLFRAAEPPLPRHSANAFALFLKSQRKWTSPSLQDTSIELFKKRMKDLDYDPKHVLPHGSYLINLGNPDRYVVQSMPALVPLSDSDAPADLLLEFQREEDEIIRVFPGRPEEV
jgi:hypothetical protein